MGETSTAPTTSGEHPVTAGVRDAGIRRAGVSRRRLLVALGLVPVALAAGCAFGDEEPDPLLALAGAARADLDLATATIAGHPELAERIEPLRAARSEHAAALDTEILRLDPDHDPTAVPEGDTAPPAPQVPTDSDDALAAVRDAAAAAGAAASDVALGLPAERVGLVAAVSACCTTYAALLATEARG